MKIQLPDIEMSCGIHGKGLPILFIHGYPLNSAIWSPQVTGLGDSALLITPDLRGHGDSEPTDGTYTMDLLAQDCHALLQELEIDQPVVLCGHSMGGYVALAFYRMYPHRVAGMILNSTKAAPDSPEARSGRDKAIDTARTQGVRVIAEQMAPKLLSPQTQADRPNLLNELVELMAHTSLPAVVGDLQGMKTRPDSLPLLPEISVPTLIIHGAHDAIIPLTEAVDMQKRLPDAVLCSLPGAGHLPNMERPELFNLAVRAFIERLEVE